MYFQPRERSLLLEDNTETIKPSVRSPTQFPEVIIMGGWERFCLCLEVLGILDSRKRDYRISSRHGIESLTVDQNEGS